MGIFFRITRIIAYNILHVNINLNLIHMYLSRNGPLLIFLFFHFVVLQLCELPDWRRSVHATGHWERCSEREQKRCCAASEAFLQNRPTTTSKHSILSSHKWTCHWFSFIWNNVMFLLFPMLSTRWPFLMLSPSFTLPWTVVQRAAHPSKRTPHR